MSQLSGHKFGCEAQLRQTILFREGASAERSNRLLFEVELNFDRLSNFVQVISRKGAESVK